MQNRCKDFIKPSEAKEILASRMFGGLPRRQDINEIKQAAPRLRVRAGAWQEFAARRLREAVVEGELKVYASNGACTPPTELPIELVRRLIPIRGGIPDHPYRLKVGLVREGILSSEDFTALQSAALLLSKEEFENWCRAERSKGRWPSQQSSQEPRRGRPPKVTNALKSRIMAFVEEGIWTAAEPITSLQRLLAEVGQSGLSHDTLARTVDRLHLETGNTKLRRKIRRRHRHRTCATPSATDVTQKLH